MFLAMAQCLEEINEKIDKFDYVQVLKTKGKKTNGKCLQLLAAPPQWLLSI